MIFSTYVSPDHHGHVALVEPRSLHVSTASVFWTKYTSFSPDTLSSLPLNATSGTFLLISDFFPRALGRLSSLLNPGDTLQIEVQSFYINRYLLMGTNDRYSTLLHQALKELDDSPYKLEFSYTKNPWAKKLLTKGISSTPDINIGISLSQAFDF